MHEPQPQPAAAQPTQRLPVAALREAYEEWSRTCGASFEGFINLIADEVVLGTLLDRYSGDAPEPTLRGREGAYAFISAFTAGPWEILAHQADRMVAEGDTIVWIGSCRARNRATGLELETPLVDIWRFDDDGKEISFYEMCDSLAFARAAGSTDAGLLFPKG